MKILVAGTGSIGKRHIANLRRLGADVMAYSYRAAAGGQTAADGALDGVRLFADLQAALDADAQAVVIANRTDQHLALALQAARRGLHLFIEKPLATSLAGVDELSALCQNGHPNPGKNHPSLAVETGFMLRFHPNLRWIKEYLRQGLLGPVMHLRAAVGQWLPDWRPGTDHRTGYGAFRKTGGGVIFDLIHELDLIHWLGGAATEVVAMTRHLPALAIETEAIAQIGLKLESNALAQVHLDYVRPGYGRSLEIVGALGTLNWDYVSGTVTLARADGSQTEMNRLPVGFERNTMFMDHMAYFLRRIREPELPAASSLNDGIHALRLALAAHQSDETRRFVRPEEINPEYCVGGV